MTNQILVHPEDTKTFSTRATTCFKRLLPQFIRNKVSNSQGLKTIALNAGWLLFDKLLRMGVGLLVGVWIARYLVPADFGTMNYSLAFVGVIGAFASFGVDGIVIRELVKNPENAQTILGTTFALKLLGGVAALFISAISITWVRQGDIHIFWLVVICGSSVIFQAFDTIDLYFQAKVASKYTVWAKNASFLMFAIVRVVLILFKFPLTYFVIATTAEVIVGAIFMSLIYHYKFSGISKWKVKLVCARNLLNESWPLIMSSVASMLNMRIGQVILGGLISDTEVGNYSAAVRISEIWLLIPSVISSSIYPSLIMAKKRSEELYRQRIRKMFRYLIYSVIPVAIAITLASHSLVQMIYGSSYKNAGTFLAIHIWTGVPYLVGFAFNNMIYIENLVKIAFYASVISPILNIGFSLLLAPRFGGIGVAIATLIASLGSTMLSLYLLNRKTGIIYPNSRLQRST